MARGRLSLFSTVIVTMVHNIPRFSNPHLLPDSSQITSRKSLYFSDSEEDASDVEAEQLLENLNERIQNCLDTSAVYEHYDGEISTSPTQTNELGVLRASW